uniref:Uncharacterized protein n=1 Tax=Solanum tuberosum TaxID=4113 RepID=M1DHM1_SOLTU
MDRQRDHDPSSGSWSLACDYWFWGSLHEPYHGLCEGPQTVKTTVFLHLGWGLLAKGRQMPPRPVIKTTVHGGPCDHIFAFCCTVLSPEERIKSAEKGNSRRIAKKFRKAVPCHPMTQTTMILRTGARRRCPKPKGTSLS